MKRRRPGEPCPFEDLRALRPDELQPGFKVICPHDRAIKRRAGLRDKGLARDPRDDEKARGVLPQQQAIAHHVALVGAPQRAAERSIRKLADLRDRQVVEGFDGLRARDPKGNVIGHVDQRRALVHRPVFLLDIAIDRDKARSGDIRPCVGEACERRAIVKGACADNQGIIDHERRSCAMSARAALRPGKPVTPPPGCVPAPHR